MKLGCVWMASGQGKRFGSNKLMADLSGQPVIAYALKAVPPELFVCKLVVTRWHTVAEFCQTQGIPALLHDRVDRNEVIALGIARMQGMDGCLFFQGDQPLCSGDSIRNLVENFKEQPNKIHRLSWNKTQASPVIFPAHLFDALEHLSAKQGGGTIIAQNPHLVQLTQALFPWELWDVDTPQALQEISRYLPK